MGGGTPRATTTAPPTPPITPPPSPSFLRPLPVIPAPPLRHSCAPSPSFLRRQEPPPPPNPPPFPNSSLPPLRGEVRWGVGGHEPATTAAPSPNRPLNRQRESDASPVILPPPSVIPAQAGTQTISAVSVRLNIPPKPLPRRRRTLDADSGCAHRLSSCLRRNDGKWRRTTQRGRRGDGEGAQDDAEGAQE